MATNSDNFKGQRALIRFLQRLGKVSAAESLRYEQMAVNEHLAVSEVLEREGAISEKDLAVLLAETLRLPLIDLTSFPLDPQVARAVKEGIAAKYEVVPVRLDERVIEVATANPLDLDALRAVEFATGRRAHALVATRVEVRDALAHAYRLEESLEQFLKDVPQSGSLTVTELREDKADLRSVTRDAELPPVVKLADLVLVEGIKSGASDIHLEPCTDAMAVRCRIDGILEEAFRFPKWVQNALVARFKVLAKLDITERRVPQDGRIQVRFDDRNVDLRVSSLPTQHGEKITLRVLDTTRAVKALDALGFSEDDMQRVRDAINRPEGMILVTGPTGSGKTTTLYALIRELYSPTVNIVTIENPIEYQIPGINQVEINEKQGLTFASVLRSCLRQDPDVILVGEIRDQETAQIALQAAQTGHLVLSTLHTNDAAATVTRLLDLGIEPYVLGATLNLIIAQRLVRRVCPQCSTPYTPPDESRRLLRLDHYRKRTDYRRGLGCPACRQSGYAGRMGVYEVFPISPSVGQLIEAGSAESVIRQQSRVEGFTTLLEDALAKLSAGLTTAEEVLRVVQVQVADGSAKPAAESVAAPPSAEPAIVPVRVAPPAAQPAAPARSFKALVVDDDPDLRRIVRMTLERAELGLTVVTAQDGPEAFALADLERPDVVILDVSMPGMDGYEVCRRLRADVRYAFVPVLMLTAKDSLSDVTRGFQVGSDDYVIKPFRREDLVARVRRMLERTYGMSAVPPAREATAPRLAASGE